MSNGNNALHKLFNSPSDDLDLINQSMEATANLELHKLERGLRLAFYFCRYCSLDRFFGNSFRNGECIYEKSSSESKWSRYFYACRRNLGCSVNYRRRIDCRYFYHHFLQRPSPKKLGAIVKDMQDNAIEHIIKYKKNNARKTMKLRVSKQRISTTMLISMTKCHLPSVIVFINRLEFC